MSDLVFIGLGSNLNTPEHQIEQAITALGEHENIVVTKLSSLYSSSPMGPKNQPNFVNAVCSIKTSLTPMQLLDFLQTVELAQGRVREGERWGPRTLDLDILLYKDLTIKTNRLIVPHVGMFSREFVLIPLFEIAEDLIFPNGQSLAKCISQSDLAGLYRLNRH